MDNNMFNILLIKLRELFYRSISVYEKYDIVSYKNFQIVSEDTTFQYKGQNETSIINEGDQTITINGAMTLIPKVAGQPSDYVAFDASNPFVKEETDYRIVFSGSGTKRAVIVYNMVTARIKNSNKLKDNIINNRDILDGKFTGGV
jgi:hypothetical protein